MTNYTQQQIELKAHIEASNEKFVAECKANGATAWGVTVSDPSHWAESGIFTIEQYERSSIVGYISDTYKSAHGFRPRMDFDSMTMVELEEFADQVSKEASEEYERQQTMESECYVIFKKHLANLVDMGAKDFKQALVWDMEAMDVNGDVGYYCYMHNLAYGKQRVIERLAA